MTVRFDETPRPAQQGRARFGAIALVSAVLASSVVAIGLWWHWPLGLACGTFVFSGVPNEEKEGIIMALSFLFRPWTCASTKKCDADCAIQVIRIRDGKGHYYQPLEQQTRRMVLGRSDPKLNGWAIDRGEERRYGHYGRNNDGTFDPTLAIPGKDGVEAVFMDKPQYWGESSQLPLPVRFEGITVPMCLTGECADRILGYYYWRFEVSTGNVVTIQAYHVAERWMLDAVDEAIEEWTEDARNGLGQSTVCWDEDETRMCVEPLPPLRRLGP